MYLSYITPPRTLLYLDIAKQFRIGRQEDSHEFARYLVDALQRSCLIGYDRYDLAVIFVDPSRIFVFIPSFNMTFLIHT